MKKFVSMIIVALSCLMLTSCATSMAAETSVAATIEYYDYLNGYIVVYFDGIPSYRFWDATYGRYYYRPVPRERFSYIRNRPAPHHHHPGAHPGHRPDVHHGGHHGRPVNHRPDVRPNQPPRSFSHSSTRVTAPRGNAGHHPGGSHSIGSRPNGGHSGGGHFGGRR